MLYMLIMVWCHGDIDIHTHVTVNITHKYINILYFQNSNYTFKLSTFNIMKVTTQ